jgi:hypothetical protein
MYFKSYGSTVYLEPLFNNTECYDDGQCYWLLPDRKTRLDYSIYRNSTSKYSISSNGVLAIDNIQPIDNGICHFIKSVIKSTWCII